MTQSTPVKIFLRTLGLGLAISAFQFLFLSCNDTGTSPYAPHFSYKRSSVADMNDRASLPDSVLSDGGYVTGYSVKPALPAGLVLDAATGVISGTPTLAAVSAPRSYTVIATGPRGADTTVVTIEVKLNVVYYNFEERPVFMWASVNTHFTPAFPDTSYPKADSVTGYTVTPALPTGVSLNPTTGVISGTPTATLPASEFNVVARGPFGADTSLVYLGVYSSAFPVGLLEKGMARFEERCTGCHGENGEGSRCPPLNHSDFLIADKHRLVRLQLMGLPNFVDTSRQIVIKGDTLNSSMPSIGGSDSEIAGVLTFVRAFLNNGAADYLSVQEVGQERDSLKTACPDAHARFLLNPDLPDCDITWFTP